MNKKLISLITMISIIFTSVSPAFAKSFNLQQNVALNHEWTVNFNQKINVNEAFEGVYIEDSKGNKISTKISFNDDHTKMIITPSDGYAPNTTYTLNVEGVSNEQGKPLNDKATMQFTTANTSQVGSFDIASVTVNNGQGAATTNLDPNSSFSFQLNKNVDPSTLNNVTVTDSDGNKANVKVEAVGSNISIIPNNTFWDDTHTIDVPRNAYKCNTTYTLNLNGVKSADGQDIATKTYKFTTRDYKLNPTIQGICNDDYISFGSQYASELYEIPHGVLGGIQCYAQSIQKCHDNNGTLVLDNDFPAQHVHQITNDWNPYANLQNRNMVNLQVELRKQYKKILASHPEYAGFNIGFNEIPPELLTYNIGTSDFQGFVDYNLEKDVCNLMTGDMLHIFSAYSEAAFAGGDCIMADGQYTKDLVNIACEKHPQVGVTFGWMPTDKSMPKEYNLSRLTLYQSLYCMFGGDYAGEIYDYIIKETGLGYYELKNTYTNQIGNIAIWNCNGHFIFKY